MGTRFRRIGPHRVMGLVLLLTVLASVQAAAEPPAFELERFDHAAKPPAGGVLVINPYGDVRVRQGATDEALFNAVMQLIGDAPLRGAFEHRIESDRLVFEVTYPEGQQPASVTDGRVDVGLILPSNAALEIRTDLGRVLSKTLDSPLTIRATDGAVEAGTRSTVDIETRDGPVRLLVRPGRRADALGRIASVRGDIEVQFARDVPIAVDARTGASLTTNDPTLLQSRTEQAGRSKLGDEDDHPLLRLDSDSGRLIVVNRSFIPGARPDEPDE